MADTWNGDAIIKNLEKELAKNLERAAIHLTNKVKEVLNVDQPYERIVGEKGIYYKGLDPSKEGEPPHKLRGDLQRSIAYEMAPDKKAAYVGTDLKYGFYLELGTTKMVARPFLRSTLINEAENLSKIIAGGKA